jgi:hypothetical protein
VGWFSWDDVWRAAARWSGRRLATPPGLSSRQLWLGERDDGAHGGGAGSADPPRSSGGARRAGRCRRRSFVRDDPCVELRARARPGGVTWLRLLNASPEARSVQLRWNGPGALCTIDLRGRALESESAASRERELRLRPWQLVALAAGPADSARSE